MCVMKNNRQTGVYQGSRSSVTDVIGVLSLAFIWGCQDVDADHLEPEQMFEIALERHSAGQDAPVTAAPIASSAVAGKMIHIYTGEPWVERYRAVGSEDMDPLPVGTAILREIYGEDGQLEKITAMVRADPELYTELGGWVFGVFDSQGEVMMADDGLPQMGELEACMQCHLGRANSQFLFGLPQ